MSPRDSAPKTASVLFPSLLLAASLAGGAWWAIEAVVVQQTLREGRTVADLAENVGKWASQYGGVHARTVGADAKFPGNFLTRASFAASGEASGALNGIRIGDSTLPSDALKSVETYYWKNPALIQREVADVITASGSLSRYRLTARTVLNKNNAPSAFEIEALDALQADTRKSEYWKISGGQLQFARAVVAQESCLRCHTSAETAPEFIRTNNMFNGGGGFGYVANQPAGLISVTVPLHSPIASLRDGFDWRIGAALGAAAFALVWLVTGRNRSRKR